MPKDYLPSRRGLATAAITSEPGPQRRQAIEFYLVGLGSTASALRTLIFEAITCSQPETVVSVIEDLSVHVPSPVMKTLALEALAGPEGGTPLRDPKARQTAAIMVEELSEAEFLDAYYTARQEAASGDTFAAWRFAYRYGNLAEFAAENQDLIEEIAGFDRVSTDAACAQIVTLPEPEDLSDHVERVKTGPDAVNGVPRLRLPNPEAVSPVRQVIQAFQSA
jgi:hypothetical protein